MLWTELGDDDNGQTLNGSEAFELNRSVHVAPHVGIQMGYCFFFQFSPL